MIQFDYSRAISQAGQIETIASEMRTLASGKVSDAMTAIDASWDGNTSTSFLTHCEGTKTEITATAGTLDGLAGQIREAARIIKEAEEAAQKAIDDQLLADQAAAATAGAATGGTTPSSPPSTGGGSSAGGSSSGGGYTR
jgi:uncharacterized protein YukE